MRGILFQQVARLPMLLGLGAMMAVAGCSSNSDHEDLKDYVVSVKNRPSGAVEPLPPLRTYDAYVYNVTARRSPFDPPVVVREVVQGSDPNVRPDTRREKEYLESFRIDALRMVGTVELGGVFWALIRDANGGINRVRVGNFLGRDHGQIVAISPIQVDLVEIVSDGLGGWLQRPRTLKLSEKE